MKLLHYKFNEKDGGKHLLHIQGAALASSRGT